MTRSDQITKMIEKDYMGDFFTKLDNARKELASEDKELRKAYEKINSRSNWSN